MALALAAITIAAAKQLVAGPAPGSGAETQIPADVEVDGVEVADGTATVDLSSGFLKGIPTDPDDRDDLQEQELAARLGQVTYTLTQFDGVKAVKVVSGGTPVEQRAERADYAKPAHGPQRKARPKGEKSTSTKKVQQRLADLRYLPRSAADGVEGYRTQQAVIAFQAWEGLGRDGVVGPLTSAALAKAKPPKPRADGPSRRIEVYRDKGVAVLISHGKPMRAIHVSAGAAGTSTPAGSFEVFRKETALMVGAVPGLAAVRLVLQQRHRVSRVPRRAAVPGLAWLRSRPLSGGADRLPLRQARHRGGCLLTAGQRTVKRASPAESY